MDSHTLTVLDFQKVQEIVANLTQTELGREAALKMMPNPDAIWVKRELDCVEELLKFGDDLNLGLVTDIRSLVGQANQGLLNPTSLAQIRISLGGLRKVREFFAKRKNRLRLTYEIAYNIKTFEPIEQAIDKAIDEAGSIRDDASPELQKIRMEIRQRRNEIVNRLEKIRSAHPDYFQEQGLTIKGDRFVLALKLEAKGKIAGILHDYSATGKTLFIEPLELVETQNELAQLRSAEAEAIKRILAQLTELVNQNRSAILSSLAIIEKLDLLQAKKNFALRFDCVKPQITENGQLAIRQCRHPLLQLRKREVVPLDFSLPDNTKVILISGPNAGGKTVVLKTVGLLASMLACGMYLPAQYVAMPIYQNVFADIGDEQSLESDLSSFSAHLLRIKGILQDADPKSLVLLDEIGSSTDPQEGSALAMAMLESLRDKGALTLATSHFGQLKLFVQNASGMANAAMEFLGRPTYRLIMGIPGESSALAISQELGLPQKLLNRAKEYLGKDWLDLSEEIKRLSAERTKTEVLNRTLAQTKAELEQLKNEYASKVAQFQTFQAEERKKMRTAMSTLLKTTRKEIENLVREIKEKNAEKSAIVQAKKYIEERLEKLSEVEPEIRSQNLSDYKPGDWVYSRTFRKQGLVVATDQDSVTIALGSIKIKLPPEDLEKIETKQSPTDWGQLNTTEPAFFNPRLTIRGMTAEEAKMLLERFLDDAQLVGAKQLTILHGKGKAILKKMVWERLRRDPRVETIRLAEPYEGGDGVTIVKLK